MRNRNFLWVLRPGGVQGELQEIAQWQSLLPSLWRILLAHGRPATGSDLQCVLGDSAVHCAVAEAAGALQRYERVAQFLYRHPQIAQVAGLKRYLDGARQYLSDVVDAWTTQGAPAPVFCANFDELARRQAASAADVMSEQLMQCARQWQGLEQAMHTEDFAAIEPALCFALWNLRFTDWKAWAGVFGLALFEPDYFAHAFREPFAQEYSDFEYDELGSEAYLGRDCHRYKENGRWGVRRVAAGRETVVLQAEWERVLRAGEDEEELVWVKRNGQFGLAAFAGPHAGCVLVEPSLDAVDAFNEGVAIVRCKTKMGFLARDGAWRVKPVWDEVCEYVQDRAVVVADDKFGYIDAQGTSVIAPQFDEADDFNPAGVARVRVAQLCGLIRRDGGIALPIEYARIEWSESFEGWLCIKDGAPLLVQADGSPWIEAGWDAIEVFVPQHLIRVSRNGRVGLLRWNGGVFLSCEYDELTPRCNEGGRAIEVIARRAARVGLIDADGNQLIPFAFSAIETLEPHHAAGRTLNQPDLVRVRSVPGEARPRRGIWDLRQQRCVIPCQHDFVGLTLLGDADAYGFIVATRNAKRGESFKGKYQIGLLRADGSTLVPKEYAWIGEQTPLGHADAINEIRDTLYFNWSRAQPVAASVNKSGPLVWLPKAMSERT